MVKYLKLVITVLFMPMLVLSQHAGAPSQEDKAVSEKPDGKRAAVDSLGKEEIQLMKDAEKVRARLDSLNSLVSEEYTKSGVIDTIVGLIEKSGTVYQQPDILSKKLFKARNGEIIVLIGFKTEWFKIIHKKGIGFILEESIKHDDRIYNYKKIQREKNLIPEWEEDE
jgi:hypothetical protein